MKVHQKADYCRRQSGGRGVGRFAALPQKLQEDEPLENQHTSIPTEMKPLVAIRNVRCIVRCCIKPPADDIDGPPPPPPPEDSSQTDVELDVTNEGKGERSEEEESPSPVETDQ